MLQFYLSMGDIVEELRNNKIFRILFLAFIFISIIHIGYAVWVNRGMYNDGGYFMLVLLDNLERGEFRFEYDACHTRFCLNALIQVPVILAYLLGIKSKFFLMGVYTFAQLAFPFLTLLWNYKLTERTKRTDIFLWSLFSYCAICSLFLVYSIVESLIGFIFNFILWNYLASKIDYKKRDILIIIFLLIMMAGTYEYNAYLAFCFFIAHFFYAFKEEVKFNKIIKHFIGLGCLAVSVFDIIYILHVPGEEAEITRYLKEFTDYLPCALDLNILMSIVTVILIAFFMFKKKPIGYISLAVIFAAIGMAFISIASNLVKSLIPMWECHMRTIPCYMSVVIFGGLFIKDVLNKPENITRTINLICICLVCGIFQANWQMVNSFFWQQNIQYMRNVLNNSDEVLYIPEEHEEVSSFFNDELRRYIWHGMYPAMSILFSETYEQKTLLSVYGETLTDGDVTQRENFYVHEDVLVVPFGVWLKQKNAFWDLTKCAEAVDKYNTEHNIHTYKDDMDNDNEEASEDVNE